MDIKLKALRKASSTDTLIMHNPKGGVTLWDRIGDVQSVDEEWGHDLLCKYPDMFEAALVGLVAKTAKSPENKSALLTRKGKPQPAAVTKDVQTEEKDEGSN